MLETALRALGLSEFDIRLYLLLVAQGPLPVARIARSLEVERPTVYAALERLEARALIPGNRPKYMQRVQVESPAKVLAMLERHRTELHHIQDQLEVALPELQAAYTAKSHASALRLFEGKEQFLTVFEEVLREAKDEILFYGDADGFIAYEGEEYEKRWARRRVAKHIATRILIHNTDLNGDLVGNDPQKLRSTRFIPNNRPFEGSFMVYGGKTLLWNPKGGRAIVIEDAALTDMFRATFEIVWKQAGA